MWNQEKGNVQKHRLAFPPVPTCCDIRVELLGTLKQVVKPPPTKEQIFSEMYLSIFKMAGGWLLARGHAAEALDVI